VGFAFSTVIAEADARMANVHPAVVLQHVVEYIETADRTRGQAGKNSQNVPRVRLRPGPFSLPQLGCELPRGAALSMRY
jgi:hypothetical protein